MRKNGDTCSKKILEILSVCPGQLLFRVRPFVPYHVRLEMFVFKGLKYSCSQPVPLVEVRIYFADIRSCK